jgi:hypothetical protein
MKKIIEVEFTIIKTIEYADGTPTRISETNSSPPLEYIENGDSMSVPELIQWGQSHYDSEEMRFGAIENLLFLNRRDPKHTRAKYKQITFKVIDAKLVERLYNPDASPTVIDLDGPVGTT